MKIFMRDFFPILQEALRIPNKVISGYVDDCIQKLIKNSTFKTCIPILAAELRENKAKTVREHCIDYINEILIQWEINDKDADMLAEVIRVGLQDASIRVREVARLAYVNLFGLHPKRVDRIKANLPASVANRLIKAEESYHKAKLTATASSKPRSPSSSVNGTSKVSPTSKLSPSSLKSQPSISLMSADSSDIVISSALPIISPRGIPTEIGFRARRQSLEEESVMKIQAIFRGSLVRRQSNGLPFTPPMSPAKPQPPQQPPAVATEPSSLMIQSSLPRRTPSRGRSSNLSTPEKPSSRDASLNSAFGFDDTAKPATPSQQESPSREGLSADGSHLSIGMTVEVKGREVPTYGIVRYIGRTAFNPDGYWVGVHLAGPYGKNDGSVKGVKYFICEENCGLFVRPQTVYPLNFSEFSATQSAAKMKSPGGSAGHENSTDTTLMEKQNARDATNRTAQLCELTKLKISMTMELLYQQLECIERIEKADSLASSTRTDGSTSSRGSAVKEDERTLMTLATKERELWDVYAEKLMKLK
jgi:hypothetical protein